MQHALCSEVPLSGEVSPAKLWLNDKQVLSVFLFVCKLRVLFLYLFFSFLLVLLSVFAGFVFILAAAVLVLVSHLCESTHQNCNN